MEGTVGLSKNVKGERCWHDFIPGRWRSTIDVRDFIVKNVTPSDGDEKFLAGASKRTKAVWEKLQPYFRDEQRKGGACGRRQDALDLAGAQGGLHRPRQRGDRRGCRPTSRSFKRAIFPFGELRTVEFRPGAAARHSVQRAGLPGDRISLSSRQPAHRVLLVMLPIAAFAASGFEHAVANMYFISFGLLIKAQAAPDFWQAIHSSPDTFAALTLRGFGNNLVAVTIGNIVGGAILVAGVYWTLYLHLRPRRT